MSAFASQVLVRLDPRAREPLQAQLCASLRRAIRDGVLRPGTRLPSSRALAEDLRISRTTAVLAFDQLAAEGLIRTRAGAGTYVADPLPVDRGRPAAAAAPRVRHPPLSRRGAALASTPRASTKLGAAGAALPPRHAGARPRPRARLDAPGDAAPEGDVARPARLRRPARTARAAPADRRARAPRPRRILHGRPGRRRHGRAARAVADVPGAARSWRHGLARGSRLYRRPGGAHRCRGAHRADPGRWRRPRRRRRHPPRARAPASPTSRRRISFRWRCRWRTTGGSRCWPGRGGPAPGSSRTTTTAASTTARGRRRACRASMPMAASSTSAASARPCSPRCASAS